MNHFHFPTAVPDETIEFYKRYFGFEEKRRLGKTRVLKNENGFLLAVDEEGEKQNVSRASHLGFSLKTQMDVRFLYEQMTSEGISLLSELREVSPRAIHFYCLDPTGNVLEVGWFEI